MQSRDDRAIILGLKGQDSSVVQGDKTEPSLYRLNHGPQALFSLPHCFNSFNLMTSLRTQY